MSSSFTARVYGCAVVKAINSNFNADFAHQPRTLPDGRVYATDKALKHTVRRYLKNTYPQDGILYFKRINDNMNPLTLADTYTELTKPDGKGFDSDSTDKKLVLRNLLGMQDVRLFGSTFAAKKGKATVNLSIHGPVQFTHGLNQFFVDGQPRDDIYSEQISAPFSTDSGDEKEAAQSTLGRQSKLREGHYVYHFSVNPANLNDLKAVFEPGAAGSAGLTAQDADRLKEALRVGVTYLDSASKAGSENELLLWVRLQDGSKLVLPSFVEMVRVSRPVGGKARVELGPVRDLLAHTAIRAEVAAVELYYLPEQTELVDAPEGAVHGHLLTGAAL